MNAIGGGSRRPAALLYVWALLVPAALGGIAYAGLVVRAKVAATTAQVKADRLVKDLAAARDYLRRHQNDKLAEEEIGQTAQLVKTRVPYGPVDLDVIEYLQNHAAAAGIENFKSDVEGGIKVPRQGDDKRTPVQRMAIEPTRLQSSIIDISFSSRYKQLLLFLRTLADGPMIFEIIHIDIQRQVKGPDVQVRLQARYVYE